MPGLPGSHVRICTYVLYILYTLCTFPIGGFLLLTHLTPRFFTGRREVCNCRGTVPIRLYPSVLRQQHSAPLNSLDLWIMA